MILLSFIHSSFATTFENATPSDSETEVVLVSDPNDFFFQPFALLLTNDTGYKLQCSDNNTLINMIEGFGLNASSINFMKRLSINSSEVINSHYNDNPILNCERGNEDLYVVDYPNGDHKYFIDFLEGNSLNMVGCQGMLDAMGFATTDAINLPYEVAQSRFYDVGDEHDIHCIDGIKPVASCGSQAHESTWETAIPNGVQPFICDNGESLLNGTVICDINYENFESNCIPKFCEGGYKQGDIWNTLIFGGSRSLQCNDGISEIQQTNCNSQYTEFQNSCLELKTQAAGYFHNCIIKEDQTLACWGSNSFDQLTVPSEINKVQDVATQSHHTCAIKDDRTLSCWGQNIYGQTTIPNNLGPVLDVATGYSHTCAIKEDNSLNCWGIDDNSENDHGQIKVPEGLGKVISVAAGRLHTCAIKEDETLACWGSDSWSLSTVPSNLGKIKSVAIGQAHNCVIKEDSFVSCWGHATSDALVIPSDLGPVLSLAAGQYHDCAIKADNSLACWGSNITEQSAVPSDLGKVENVMAGGYHTCATKEDKTVVCWGSNVVPWDDTYNGQATVPSDLGRVF